MGYVGETRRNWDSNFKHPIVERQVDFSEEECIRTYLPEEEQVMSAEQKEKIADELLYISELDDTILQVHDEYPIVQYFASNTDNLNTFVEAVTVSVVDGRKAYYDGTLHPTEDLVGHEAIAYITNPFNMSRQIPFGPLIRFLFNKPNLVVSKEGALVFYTKDEIQVTLDCSASNIVSIQEIMEKILEGANDKEKEKSKINFLKIKEIKTSRKSNVLTFTYCDQKGNNHEENVEFDCIIDLFQKEAGVIFKVIES